MPHTNHITFKVKSTIAFTLNNTKLTKANIKYFDEVIQNLNKV